VDAGLKLGRCAEKMHARDANTQAAAGFRKNLASTTLKWQRSLDEHIKST
jgi:hypothetical protein